MSTGQAPLLMLDLATSQIRDRRRVARGLTSPSRLRRDRRATTGARSRVRTAR